MSEKNYKNKPFPSDVLEFREKCTQIVADDSYSSFWVNTQDGLEECESPIEQIFFLAIETVARINGAGECYHDFRRDVWIEAGISVQRQMQIGKYRVDFLLSYAGTRIVNAKVFKMHTEFSERQLVVELDGHQFHDRNEPQRRYEKHRDRFLQKQGYKVFHYTGSEVVQNPFKVAAECLAYLLDENEKIIRLPDED